MALRQPLQHNVAIVMEDGRPTAQFQQLWQNLGEVAAQGGVAPDTYVRRGIKNGWTAATGTASRSTFTTYAAPTAAGSYSQAQMQALMDHMQILSQHLKAFIDDAMGLEILVP